MPQEIFKIEENVAGFVVQLWIAGNPLDCTCEMGWVSSLNQKVSKNLKDFEKSGNLKIF